LTFLEFSYAWVGFI
ncbi:biotin-ligase, conserved domain family protein, partial [Chlamydia psittaci 84-8471/1]